MKKSLTPMELVKLPSKLVYEWVKTGKWTRTEFENWLEEVMVNEHSTGFALGLDDAEDVFEKEETYDKH
jgi:hypothetical protein